MGWFKKRENYLPEGRIYQDENDLWVFEAYESDNAFLGKMFFGIVEEELEEGQTTTKTTITYPELLTNYRFDSYETLLKGLYAYAAEQHIEKRKQVIKDIKFGKGFDT